MTDDTIRVEFEATLDDVVEVYVRQARRLKMYPPPALRTLISTGMAGVVGGLIGWISVTSCLGGRSALKYPSWPCREG
jgi:hypothetical protein